MTYEQLQKANAVINTTPIRGKDYAEVNQRIKAFRMCFPNGCIKTEIVSMENGVVVFMASVIDEEGRLLGTGTAYEREGSTMINKTSYIENCETSAVGRALGMCGFGIDVSIASAEEVATAIANQDNKPEHKIDSNGKISKADIAAIKATIKKKGLTEKSILSHYGIDSFENMDFPMFNDAMKLLTTKYKDKE